MAKRDLHDLSGEEHRAHHVWLHEALETFLAELPHTDPPAITTAADVRRWAIDHLSDTQAEPIREIVADMAAVTGRFPSQTTLAELRAWSEQQTREPELAFGERYRKERQRQVEEFRGRHGDLTGTHEHGQPKQ